MGASNGTVRKLLDTSHGRLLIKLIDEEALLQWTLSTWHVELGILHTLELGQNLLCPTRN